MSPVFVYIPHDLIPFNQCPRSTIALSNAPSAGRTTLPLNSNATIKSRVAPTPNFTAWPSPLAGGSRKTDSRADRALAILADNHPRWVAAYLGIIASGCAAVPLDTALHADQVTKLLKDSGTSAIFCDAKHRSGDAGSRQRIHDRHGSDGPGAHDGTTHRRCMAGQSAGNLRRRPRQFQAAPANR